MIWVWLYLFGALGTAWWIGLLPEDKLSKLRFRRAAEVLSSLLWPGFWILAIYLAVRIYRGKGTII